MSPEHLGMGPGIITQVNSKLLNDKRAKEEVAKFQKQLQQWEGPKNAAQFLYETYGK